MTAVGLGAAISKGVRTDQLGILLAAAIGALLGWPRLPDAVGVEGPPTGFSAGRAVEKLAGWATEPRPVGSDRHAQVVAALEGELRGLGFEVERERSGPLVNLVASAPGAGSEGLWLVAHSDSVAAGPGAADDGLGLGVIVEVARALSVDGVPPRLHVLFTDGEEVGLLGARAFVRSHPSPADRPPLYTERLVINIDARGTEGPAYMFQMKGASGPMLDAWRESGCPAQATSLAQTVYDVLPNDTDFTVFARDGWWGYNFALIGGASRYHTADDTVGNLDPRSVQQVGECVLGLAKAWLDRPMEGDETDRVWAQVAGRTWALPAWVVTLLGLAPLTVLLHNERRAGTTSVWRAHVGRLLRPLGAFVAVFVATATAGVLLQGAAVALWPGFTAPVAEVPGAGPLYACALGIGAAGCLFLRRIEGAIAVSAVLCAAVLSLVWPAAGYLLVPGAWVAATRLRSSVVAAIAAAFAGALLGPFYAGIGEALTSRMLPVLTVLPLFTLAWAFGSPRGVVAPTADRV